MNRHATFTHSLQGARAIGGEFELEREERLAVGDREAIYLVGNAHVDTACCGVTGCRYAVVPGWVVAWHSGRDANGTATSEVELIEAEAEQRAVRRAIEARERVNQVVFW